MTSLLPSELVGKNGRVQTVDALKGKHVLFYFSAHWCPPCRGFTPALADFYKKHAASKGFEIVFVSSDKDQGEFDGYYGEHPWLALPYEERDLKAKLTKRFKVQGIPSLVVLDPSGKTITTDARTNVSQDPEALQFPWIPPTMAEMLGDSFVNAKGETVSMADLAGKHIGIYFSAHWCPPCRGFTPELAKTYATVQKAGKEMEMIFVSSDKDEASFKEYLGEMPWLALPFDKRREKEQLSQHFEVRGIPSLVILDADLNVVNGDARGAVGNDPQGAEFPWAPKLVEDVEEGANILNETASVVVLMEEAADSWDRVEGVLTGVAEQEKARGGNGGDVCAEEGAEKVNDDDAEEVRFLVAKESGSIASQLRKLLKLGKARDVAHMVLLDFGSGGLWYEPKDPADVTTESVKAFVSDFRAGSLEAKSLKG